MVRAPSAPGNEQIDPYNLQELFRQGSSALAPVWLAASNFVLRLAGRLGITPAAPVA